MTVDSINITETLKDVEKVLAEDKELSHSVRSLLEVLVLIITLLANKLNLNSKNSSKPPSSDPDRKKTPRKKGKNKPGGQQGHEGSNLEKVDDPDLVEVLKVDRSQLPKGIYKSVGYEVRQVFDIQISRFVTEYQAEILSDSKGKRYTAAFPEEVTKATQYGAATKAHSVYMSQFQLIPYERVVDYFADQMGLPLSAGSIFNFNKLAYEALESFEILVKQKLVEAGLIHADETSINIGGKKFWLHCCSNDSWTFLYPHKKRGLEAMEHMGILPSFKGILCHDHWKPYYRFECLHTLCNAHHLRELTRAWEQDDQQWAKEMHDFLEDLNKKVLHAGGALSSAISKKMRQKYDGILKKAEQECPPPKEKRKKGQRGRLKRSKSRNLLERLRDYKDDVLRFMDNLLVPFTNNQGERDIRMLKVQQKISGSFRSEEGAKIFCRIRSYLSTCSKQNISPTTALELLFQGRMPDFQD